MGENCVFCNMAVGKVFTKKIYENDNFFSIPDANPIVDGHTLVIGKKHFENILELPNSQGPELLDCIKKTAIKLIEKKKGDAFNVINNNLEAAGQIVNHVHFHIIPRKKDDNIRFFTKQKS